MTNGDLIRTLNNKGVASLILCVKCWVKSQDACINRHTCPKWREFVKWLGEEVEVITSKTKQNEQKNWSSSAGNT